MFIHRTIAHHCKMKCYNSYFCIAINGSFKPSCGPVMTWPKLISCNSRFTFPSVVNARSFSNYVRYHRTLPCKDSSPNVFVRYKFVPNVIVKRIFSRSATESSNSKSKVKFSTANIARLISLAKPEKWKLAGAIFLLLISSTVTMAVPFALGKVIDIIYTNDSAKMKENLNKVVAVLFGVFLLGGLCNFGRVYLMSISGHRISRDLRQNVFRSLVSQEVAYFDKSRTGELVNRLSADTQLISHSITSNISDGLRSTIMVVAGVSMMFYMSPMLAAVGLSVVPPVALLAVFYGRFVRKISKEVQDSLADATAVAEERISNMRTVKAFSNEMREVIAYNGKLDYVLQLAYKESFARGLFFGLTGLTGNIIILSGLYYGGVMVSDATLTIGNLSSFLLYAFYIGISVNNLTSFYSELNKSFGASVRLWEILDRTPAIPLSGGLIPQLDPKGLISFQNVTFSYPTRKGSPVLQNLNLNIPEASVTAVVGSSGSGKSTLASLLLRLYDPDEGSVRVDGRSIHELDPAWLRKHIGFVSQEPILFSSSIRENILYGAADPSLITEQQFLEATREANCLDFITKTFPKEFETRVGERGVLLSGGQKQRIAIARALIKNPRILLLDEATSALDAESEHLVQEALERIMKGRTVLTIAHRLSTIKNANQIAVLEKGRIVEIGNYQQLMSNESGAFKKLIRHQTFL